MYGRYGSDNLNRFLLGVYGVVWFLSFIVDNVWAVFLMQLLSWGLFFCICFRMFSKKIYARQIENQAYLMIKRKVVEYFRYLGNKWKFRKTHVYRKCPSCKSRLKLPKIKGSHNVKCPKCARNFSVKI
jgi:hypothetical protein